jgi:Flp pilus assembly protein CpaB
MTYRVKNIGIAVILAAFAGLLTIFYVTQYKRHVQHGESQVSVLVAARDIPAGTTGAEVVGQHYLTTEMFPRRTVVPGAVSNSNEISNSVVTQQIFKGEQVTTRSFGSQAELGVRAQLSGNERGIQMGGDANQVLAGILKEGDYVDVVGAWKINNVPVSRIIVRNALVLQAPAPPAKGGGLGGGTNQSFAVVLRMSDSDSQKIKFVNEEGDGTKWHLELRPPSNSTDSPNTYQNPTSMLSNGPGIRWNR